MPDNSNPETPEDANAAKIRDSLDKVDLSNSLSKPIRQAIDDLLKVAQETVGSADASVLVRDGREGGLRFLVAVSELEEALLKIRIPPGKGIAGRLLSGNRWRFKRSARKVHSGPRRRSGRIQNGDAVGDALSTGNEQLACWNL